MLSTWVHMRSQTYVHSCNLAYIRALARACVRVYTECRIKEKVMSYIELAPFVGNAQSALVTESTGRPTNFNTDLSGKYLYTLHLLRDDVHVYPSLSIARWSIIQLSELR